MSFPRYDRYKNAGIGWLSEVPAHWQVIPNKALLRATNDLVGTNSSDFTLLSLTLFGVIVRDIESGKGKFPAEFDSYKAVEPNDLIFCLFDLDETPRTIGLANQVGMITGAYEVLRCRPLALPSYICYFYLHVDEFKGLRPWYTGLRKVVRPDTFMSIKLALPPLDEQEAIASFLDAETAKIDALIEEQRRLIELLKEKRQAVISHAVTRGLNPGVTMATAGVDWLNEIPAHWAGIPLGYLIRFNSGGTPNKANEGYWDGSIPWVSPKDMKVVEIGDAEDHVTELALAETGLRLIEPDHILVVVRGMILLHSFPVARNLVPVTINQDMKALKCCDKLLPGFLQYLFRGIAKLLVSLAGESAHGTKKMETSILSGLQIPLPPIEEQQSIIAWLDEKLAAYDSLLENSTDAIRLLEQRRSALISAAVTGKIDVRSYVPKEAA